MHAFLRDHPLCQNHARQRPGPAAFGTYLTRAERQKPVGGLLSFAASAFVVLPTPPSQRDSDNDADRSPLARDKSLEHLGHSTDPEGAQCFTPGRTPCSQTACCHFTQLLERMSVMRMCVILFPLICCWLWGMWLDYIQSHICRGMFSSSYEKQKASDLCYCCSICNRPLTMMHRFFSLPKRNHSLTFCITAHCSVHTIATSKSDVVAG